MSHSKTTHPDFPAGGATAAIPTQSCVPEAFHQRAKVFSRAPDQAEFRGCRVPLKLRAQAAATQLDLGEGQDWTTYQTSKDELSSSGENPTIGYEPKNTVGHCEAQEAGR